MTAEFVTAPPKEATTSKIITWKPFFEALKANCLLPDPDRTSRIVIDAKVGDVCTITYYTFADERLVDALGVVYEAKNGGEAFVR